jgi:transposase
MDLADTDLPDDIDALKALVRAHAVSAHAVAQQVDLAPVSRIP